MSVTKSSIQYTNIYFVDAILGDDDNGNGVDKPFKTLEKLLSIIPKNENAIINLGEGEYTFDENIASEFSNCDILVEGMGLETKLVQTGGVYANVGGGDPTYTLTFCRLVYSASPSLSGVNINCPKFQWNLNNVVFGQFPNTSGTAYFIPATGSTIVMNNCVKAITSAGFLRVTNENSFIQLNNCYGAFTSGYNTTQDKWDNVNNIIIDKPNLDEVYKITTGERIGVYFGKYQWYDPIGFEIDLAKGVFSNMEYIDGELQLKKITTEGSNNEDIFHSHGSWESSIIRIPDKFKDFQKIAKKIVGNANYTIYTRSSEDGYTWSEYQQLSNNSITSPFGEYIQVKIDVIPELRDVEFIMDSFQDPYDNRFVDTSNNRLKLKKNYSLEYSFDTNWRGQGKVVRTKVNKGNYKEIRSISAILMR